MTGIWQTDKPPLDLVPGQIHVWRIALNRPVADISMLSDDEQKRAARLHDEHNRHCFIAARCGLRQILGRYLAQDADAIAFEYGQYGKPFLAEGAIAFNLAHSGDLALIAVAVDRTVGIDLERMKPMQKLESLTQRFFTAGEHQRIVALAPEHRSLAFFRTWTCKEAYLKATGDGLRQLKGVEVVVRPQQEAQFVNPVDWDLQEMQPGKGFVGAIAAPGFDWQTRLFDGANI